MSSTWDNFFAAAILAVLAGAIVAGVAYFAPTEWRLLATISSAAAVVVFAVFDVSGRVQLNQEEQIALLKDLKEELALLNKNSA